MFLKILVPIQDFSPYFRRVTSVQAADTIASLGWENHLNVVDRSILRI
ncbi:hypothetical protein [Richelia intracellularis]|nr:hypothetical protein [Richelia intracellularis]